MKEQSYVKALLVIAVILCFTHWFKWADFISALLVIYYVCIYGIPKMAGYDIVKEYEKSRLKPF